MSALGQGSRECRRDGTYRTILHRFLCSAWRGGGVSLRPVGVESTSVGGPIGHPPTCTAQTEKQLAFALKFMPKNHARACHARAMRHAKGRGRRTGVRSGVGHSHASPAHLLCVVGAQGAGVLPATGPPMRKCPR